MCGNERHVRDEPPLDAVREQAALYALDLLEPDDARAFEARLRAGCPVATAELRDVRETLALLPLALPDGHPSPAVRERLLARAQATSGLHVVRADEGVWEPASVPGVHVKRLHREGDRVTTLVRMEPGATFPAHHHPEGEHCLVLEGDLHAGDLVLRAGDYQHAAARTTHLVTWTEQGCLLFLVASARNQIVP